MSKTAAKRIQFEHQNMVRIPLLERAEFAFEISSEGELEQIFPLIETLVKEDKGVELVYASDSVDEKIKNLVKEYPHNIRAHILPLIGYQPWSKSHNIKKWLTARNVFLCRYDFFPELISYGRSKAKNFTLLSASMKGYQKKGAIAKAYYRWCLRSFDKIVAVSFQEKEKLIKLAGISPTKIEVFDFRIIQIKKRLENKEKTLDGKWPAWREFQGYLQQAKGKKIILGSYWPDDLEIVKKGFKEHSISLVPHKLSIKNLEQIRQSLVKSNIPYYEINLETKNIPTDFEGVFLVNLKGILCELYTLFEYAYVGGGFGESVHSVLEPYLAGCRVLCGPNNDRSSEFDVISEYDQSQISSHDQHDKIVEVINFEERKPSSSRQFSDHFIGHLPALLMWLGVKEGEDYA